MVEEDLLFRQGSPHNEMYSLYIYIYIHHLLSPNWNKPPFRPCSPSCNWDKTLHHLKICIAVALMLKMQSYLNLLACDQSFSWYWSHFHSHWKRVKVWQASHMSPCEEWRYRSKNNRFKSLRWKESLSVQRWWRIYSQGFMVLLRWQLAGSVKLFQLWAARSCDTLLTVSCDWRFEVRMRSGALRPL